MARAPFVRVFYGTQELSMNVERFRYVYDEEGSDFCELTFSLGDKMVADSDAFAEKAQWKMSWGYMGEPNTIKTRTVYIQDIKWGYGKTISAEVTLTDKAHSTLFDNSPAVYNNATLPDIAKKIADKHDLNLKVAVKVPEAATTTNKITDVIQSQQTDQQRRLKQVFLDYDLWNKTNKKSPNWKYNSSAEGEDVNKSTNLPENFNLYKSIPKGITSDRLFLQRLAAREKGGQSIIDTRDDNMIVRKRNFNQVPYKTYQYMGEPNEVIEFVPEYRNRTKAAAATNLGFGGWNRESKSFYMGNANAMNDNGSDALAKVQEMVNYQKTIPGTQEAGTFVIDPLTGKIKYNPKKKKVVFANPMFSGQASAYRRDAENTVTRKDLSAAITVSEDLAATQAAINNQQGGKNLYDPTSNNPVDVFNNAANARTNKELQRNAANLKIEGDTGIEVGQVVTIAAVAEKHKGNYYIIKSEHTIDNQGYMVDMDLVREGSNYKVKGGINVTKFGKIHNNSIGQISKKDNTKTVKINMNGRH